MKNILFITSDQHHWTTMGYNNPEVKTPNLDKLAARGMIFDRAYTVNPTCTPTRASWLTGLYPSQHGAYSLGTKLMENVPTINDSFRKSGMKSGLVGKAHFQPLLSTDEFTSLESYPTLHDLDFWRNYKEKFYGFDHVELARNHTDESHAGQHYAIWMEEKGYTNWRDYFVPNNPGQTVEGDNLTQSKHKKREPGQAWEIPEEIHYNTWIADRTNALMEQFSKDKDNFFLWASFFDPHPQYMVPEPYASMYDPAKVTVPEHTPGEFDDKPFYFQYSQEKGADYSFCKAPGEMGVHGAGYHVRSHEVKAKNIAMMYGMVTMMDKYIGVILDKLEELNLVDDTLVCFTTDHGDFWGQHGLTQKAIHHYEDLLKVPMIVSMPGTIPEGERSESLQSTLDIPVTILNMCGAGAPRHMTGLDETAVWTGKEKSLRDHVIVENNHQPGKMNMKTYITDQWKITVHFNRDFGELYDLKNDPREMINLWDKKDYATIKSDLLLKFLYGEMAKESLPMPRIAGA
jgi:arylsulfatase A-like enzyme